MIRNGVISIVRREDHRVEQRGAQSLVGEHGEVVLDADEMLRPRCRAFQLNVEK
jgi:hypothetical protein